MVYDKKNNINTHLRGLLLDLNTGLLLRYPIYFNTFSGEYRLLRLRPGQTTMILHNAHVPSRRDLEEVEGRGRIQFIALPSGVPTDAVVIENPHLLETPCLPRFTTSSR